MSALPWTKDRSISVLRRSLEQYHAQCSDTDSTYTISKVDDNILDALDSSRSKKDSFMHNSLSPVTRIVLSWFKHSGDRYTAHKLTSELQ